MVGALVLLLILAFHRCFNINNPFLCFFICAGTLSEIGTTGISSLTGHSEHRTFCLNKFVGIYGHMPLVPSNVKAEDARRSWMWWGTVVKNFLFDFYKGYQRLTMSFCNLSQPFTLVKYWRLYIKDWKGFHWMVPWCIVLYMVYFQASFAMKLGRHQRKASKLIPYHRIEIFRSQPDNDSCTAF